MRRKDKEIQDRSELEDILRQADVCRIGLCEDNKPYIVPLNYGYTDGVLYIHSAREGKKIDMIRLNNTVCFEVETGKELIKKENACSWGYKYKSVIGFGKAFIVEGYEEKSKGLNIIMEHYSGKADFEFGREAVDSVTVIRIDIEEMYGKKSGY